MTDGQLSVFDIPAGIAARDAAVAAAGAHAPDEWHKAARFALLCTATERFRFTADDVWQTLASLGFGAPPEPRALGSLFVDFRKSGLIRPTGDYVQSARPEAHCSPKRVWELT